MDLDKDRSFAQKLLFYFLTLLKNVLISFEEMACKKAGLFYALKTLSFDKKIALHKQETLPLVSLPLLKISEDFFEIFKKDMISFSLEERKELEKYVQEFIHKQPTNSWLLSLKLPLFGLLELPLGKDIISFYHKNIKISSNNPFLDKYKFFYFSLTFSFCAIYKHTNNHFFINKFIESFF